MPWDRCAYASLRGAISRGSPSDGRCWPRCRSPLFPASRGRAAAGCSIWVHACRVCLNRVSRRRLRAFFVGHGYVTMCGFSGSRWAFPSGRQVGSKTLVLIHLNLSEPGASGSVRWSFFPSGSRRSVSSTGYSRHFSFVGSACQGSGHRSFSSERPLATMRAVRAVRAVRASSNFWIRASGTVLTLAATSGG